MTNIIQRIPMMRIVHAMVSRLWTLMVVKFQSQDRAKEVNQSTTAVQSHLLVCLGQRSLDCKRYPKWGQPAKLEEEIDDIVLTDQNCY